MPSSLVHGKYVVCGITSPTESTVIEDGAVYQRDGKIVEIGPFRELSRKHRADEMIGSAEHVVVPGFVNGHHHVGLTPFQLGSPDYPLELWFASRRTARDVDLYLDTLYSAFEMIESGITTVHHLHVMRRGPWSVWRQAAEQVLKAYRDIGMRVAFTFNFRDQNRLVYEADEDFVARLPASIAEETAALLAGQEIPRERYLAELFDDLWESHGRNGAERVRIQLAPHNLHWCSDGAFMALKEHAVKHGVGMHVHLLETAYQKEYARRRSGKTAVRHLHDLGFLGPDVTLGHAVWVTDEDIDILAETGTRICHNASSNLRLQSGIAPVNAFADRGLRVAIGIDEATINDDRDMFLEMRLVQKLHRVPGIEETVPTFPQVLRMATEYGAQTTHYGNEIGVLEPGRAADMVVMNWKHIAHPYLDEDTPVIDAIVQRGRTTGVETVLVAGETILRDGRSTRLDKETVLNELAQSLGVPRRPEEVRRRELWQELFPHVKRFWEGWLKNQPRDPFYRPNSRN